MDTTRRKLLSVVAGTASIGVLAGCVGDNSTTSRDGNDRVTSQASFFVFGDIADQVTGDVAESNLLVPLGQHGHGWEPGPSIREDIRGADLLIHGMSNFQPWVDDIKTDLEADNADVTAVDVSVGVDLLEAGGGGHNHGQEEQGADGREGHNDDGHDEEGDSHDEEGHNGHNRGAGMDPHFWMDPLRVKDAAGNVRQGLVDIDPDNAETYADNAEAFRTALDDLHEQMQETVDSASKEVILVAGHNALQYFGDRYGVEVAALTNVSPDDRPTTQDIRAAQEVIDRHGLEYICADPLESQQAAEQLVSETDAREVLPLTAMPGLTEDWESQGWGYTEIMENVNLPTLERALDA
jgi:zinc transport system substrate-binding protein